MSVARIRPFDELPTSSFSYTQKTHPQSLQTIALCQTSPSPPTPPQYVQVRLQGLNRSMKDQAAALRPARELD